MMPPFPSDRSSAQADTQVSDLLQRLLEDAFLQTASDIHFEPHEKGLRVRYRIDGLLHTVATPALAWRDRLLSRLKVLSRLDIAEKRLPQDGRMSVPWKGQNMNLRVSSLPTLHGEKLVVRVLQESLEALALADLGYEPHDLACLLQAIQQPDGLVLITGPTGSGKTRSLYSCLAHLNSPHVNIATVEDPAEIQLPGINQVNVNERAGLTFASALRALLRQDPDILMVGEIRDLETARIATQAAQTGHLVLSTLHTQDAPGTLLRLHDMGIEPFQMASSLLLVTSQRLVRRLCPVCKSQRPGAAEWQAVGCAACREGFAGRVGLFQVMPVTPAMQHLILTQKDTVSLAAQATREGVKSLREIGMLKVQQGLTTLREVESVTHD